MMDRPRTKEVFHKSLALLPGGVCSPVRSFQELQMTPLMVERGEGDSLWDVDGNRLFDYCMSWGALPLGHAHPKVISEVTKQLALGSSYGANTPLEVEMAQKIHVHLPSIEKVRFVSSGTEAVMSALRLARGYTGKKRIVKFNGNYHGHCDPLLVQAGSGLSLLSKASSLGVLEEVVQFTVSIPYNDIEALQRVFAKYSDIAAVIVEPVAANMGLIPAKPSFLQALAEETQKAGALLIFDEVVTGFRVGLGGAQGLFRIQPDLTCLGKVIGGGFPLAAFGGKGEIMDALAPIGGVYQAGTLSGNPLALRAGLSTLSLLESSSFYQELEEKTERFLQPIQHLVDKKRCKLCIHRMGSMFSLFFGVDSVQRKEDLVCLDTEMFKRFYQFLFSQGIYLSPSAFETHFLSSAHEEETLSSTQKVLLKFLSEHCL